MNYETFSSSGIVLVNRKNKSVIEGSGNASQPVNGNDESQADAVDGTIISGGVQFNGISDKEALKDYYIEFGAFGMSTLYEGEWKLDFDLNYTDTSREYTVSENVKADGVDRKLEKVTLSPISLLLKFEPVSVTASSDDTVSSDNTGYDPFAETKTSGEPNQLLIIMKDHTELILDCQTSDKDTLSSVLPAVIDLDQVAAIKLNETQIALTH
jgi:hypothetical protein